MVKMVVKVNLIGAVIQTLTARAVMMKANIKIFVNASLKSTFSLFIIKLIKKSKLNNVYNTFI